MSKKIKLDYYTRLSLHIMAVFTTAILISFIPDYLHDFFGDTYCKYGNAITGDNQCSVKMEYYHSADTWHWGLRHWLYCAMTILVFCIQMAKIDKIKP